MRDYENGVSTKSLMKKYSVSKSYISNMFKNRNIKRRINPNIIKNWEKIENIDFLDKNICGVYAIYFIWKYKQDDKYAFSKVNDIKLYIGSSTDIKNRLQSHVRELKNNNHDSKALIKYYRDKEYAIKYAIIEKCSSEEILQKETFHLHSYNKSCLLNTWRAVTEENLRPWLEKAITYNSYVKNYKIDPITGCKESNYVRKKGYGAMRVTIGESKDKGQTKYLYKHRVAFWEKHGKYPELVRHKCNNHKCYNPDHLEEGNHRDNNLDRRGDFPQIFESKWLELKGDLVKLSQYFSDRWEGNQLWRGSKVSYAVYYWEKELGLKTKYPEVLDANSKRRFSIAYQRSKRGKRRKSGSIRKV